MGCSRHPVMLPQYFLGAAGKNISSAGLCQLTPPGGLVWALLFRGMAFTQEVEQTTPCARNVDMMLRYDMQI